MPCCAKHILIKRVLHGEPGACQQDVFQFQLRGTIASGFNNADERKRGECLKPVENDMWSV